MEKLVERLTEKYLLKDIKRLTLEVYSKSFNKVFKYCCKNKCDHDTTLGRTFREIEREALHHVENVMGTHTNNIHIEPMEHNPFRGFLEALWCEASWHIDFKSYVSSILDDERNEKEIELQKIGLIDENGDYIAK